MSEYIGGCVIHHHVSYRADCETCWEDVRLRQRAEQAARAERVRAVAYIRVLRENHPHLRDAYEHAALNLQAALETDWQPAEALRREEGANGR